MRKFHQSLSFATKGIVLLFKTERNFRIQCIIGVSIILFSIVIQMEITSLLWIIMSVMLVIILEGVNTVVEKLMDLLERKINHEVKIVKDIAAGIVLLGSFTSIMIGCIVFGYELFGLIPIFTVPFGIIFSALLVFFGWLGGAKR
ncbi:MAG: diacylglycerol kinase family protein [Petrotogales bacterium]